MSRDIVGLAFIGLGLFLTIIATPKHLDVRDLLRLINAAIYIVGGALLWAAKP